MKGKFSERATPLTISAMRRACSSLSITQGPAMRNRSPAPTRTLSIWKDKVIGSSGDRVIGSSRRGVRSPDGPMVRSPDLSSPHFFRPQEHLDLGRVFLLFLFLPVFVRSAHECLKQRMRLQRFRFEFRMELAPDEERMTGNLHYLHVSAVGSRDGNAQPDRHHGLLILAIEHITRRVAR